MTYPEENSPKEENVGFSIHEVSERLSLPENTLRKYLAYFDLEVERIGRKNYLSEQVVQYLSEILQLKSNSWSLKQIKAFRDVQKNKLQANLAASTTQEQENTSPELTDIPENSLLQAQNKPEEEIKEQSKQEIQEQPKEEIIKSEELVVLPEAEIIQEIINISPKVIITSNQPEIQSEDNLEENNQKEEIEIINSEEEISPAVEIPNENETEEEYVKNKRIITVFNKPPLTKDYVNKEIATQAKRASRLYRFLSSRNSQKDSAEIKADLNRRVEFLNGLRYIRDNWLDRQPQHKERDLAGVN